MLEDREERHRYLASMLVALMSQTPTPEAVLARQLLVRFGRLPEAGPPPEGDPKGHWAVIAPRMFEKAKALNRHDVGPLILLLVLLEEEPGFVEHTLKVLPADFRRLRSEIERLLT